MVQGWLFLDHYFVNLVLNDHLVVLVRFIIFVFFILLCVLIRRIFTVGLGLICHGNCFIVGKPGGWAHDSNTRKRGTSFCPTSISGRPTLSHDSCGRKKSENVQPHLRLFFACTLTKMDAIICDNGDAVLIAYKKKKIQ